MLADLAVHGQTASDATPSAINSSLPRLKRTGNDFSVHSWESYVSTWTASAMSLPVTDLTDLPKKPPSIDILRVGYCNNAQSKTHFVPAGCCIRRRIATPNEVSRIFVQYGGEGWVYFAGEVDSHRRTATRAVDAGGRLIQLLTSARRLSCQMAQ